MATVAANEIIHNCVHFQKVMRNKCGIKAATKLRKEDDDQDGISLSFLLARKHCAMPSDLASFRCSFARLPYDETKWWNKYHQRVLLTYGLACALKFTRKTLYRNENKILCCCDRVLRDLRSLFLSHRSRSFLCTVHCALCIVWWRSLLDAFLPVLRSTFILNGGKRKNSTNSQSKRKRKSALCFFFFCTPYFFAIKINTIKKRFYFSKIFFSRALLLGMLFFSSPFSSSSESYSFRDCKTCTFVHNICVISLLAVVVLVSAFFSHIYLSLRVVAAVLLIHIGGLLVFLFFSSFFLVARSGGISRGSSWQNQENWQD